MLAASFSYPSILSVTIPESVTQIDPAFFALFPNLRAVEVAQGNDTYTSYNGMLFDAAKESLLLVPEGMEGEAVLPNTLATVPACVFSRCTKLSAIVVANTGSTGSVFSSWAGILYTNDMATLVAAPAGLGTSATIATDCEEIAESAFAGNTNLQTIIDNGNVATIAKSAFERKVIENATVQTTNREPWEEVGFVHFAELARPGDVAGPSENKSGLVYTLMEDGKLSVEWIGEESPGVAISIPESAHVGDGVYTVSTIAPAAFAGLASLEEIELPATITTIGESAFEDCTNLKSIIISGSIATIPARAFAGCTSLANITLNNGIRTIGEASFEGTAATELKLPSTIATVEANAFANMPNLKSIVSLGTVIDIDNTALTGNTGINIYTPVQPNDDYTWPVGLAAAANHIHPYGLGSAADAVRLGLGETADLFDHMTITAPEGIDTNYSYNAKVLSIDPTTHTAIAKGYGRATVNIALVCNEETLATTSLDIAVENIELQTTLLENESDENNDETNEVISEEEEVSTPDTVEEVSNDDSNILAVTNEELQNEEQQNSESMQVLFDVNGETTKNKGVRVCSLLVDTLSEITSQLTSQLSVPGISTYATWQPDEQEYPITISVSGSVGLVSADLASSTYQPSTQQQFIPISVVVKPGYDESNYTWKASYSHTSSGAAAAAVSDVDLQYGAVTLAGYAASSITITLEFKPATYTVTLQKGTGCLDLSPTSWKYTYTETGDTPQQILVTSTCMNANIYQEKSPTITVVSSTGNIKSYVTLVSDPNYSYAKVQVKAGGYGNLVVKVDHAIRSYSISATSGTGVASMTVDKTYTCSGATQKKAITVAPKPGYDPASLNLTLGGNCQGASLVGNTIYIDGYSYGNITISASYSPGTYTITMRSGTGATNVSSTVSKYTYSETNSLQVSISASPSVGYDASTLTWSTNSSGLDERDIYKQGQYYYLNIYAGFYGNLTVTASYEKTKYFVDFDCGESAKITSADGLMRDTASGRYYYTYPNSGEFIVTATPNIGYGGSLSVSWTSLPSNIEIGQYDDRYIDIELPTTLQQNLSFTLSYERVYTIEVFDDFDWCESATSNITQYTTKSYPQEFTVTIVGKQYWDLSNIMIEDLDPRVTWTLASVTTNSYKQTAVVKCTIPANFGMDLYVGHCEATGQEFLIDVSGYEGVAYNDRGEPEITTSKSTYRYDYYSDQEFTVEVIVRKGYRYPQLNLTTTASEQGYYVEDVPYECFVATQMQNLTNGRFKVVFKATIPKGYGGWYCCGFGFYQQQYTIAAENGDGVSSVTISGTDNTYGRDPYSYYFNDHGDIYAGEDGIPPKFTRTLSCVASSATGYKSNSPVWVCKDADTGVIVPSDEVSIASGVATIRADICRNLVFTASLEPISYAIVFNRNGAEEGTVPNRIEAKYGTTYYVPSVDLKKTGYVFDGWALDQDGVVEYRENDVLKNLTDMDGGTVTLYAHFTARTTTIKWRDNESVIVSSPVSTEVTFTYGQPIPELSDIYAQPTVSKPGSYLTGWWYDGQKYYNADGSIAYTDTWEPAVVANSIYLDAQWQPLSFNLTYEPGTNGSGFQAAGTFTYGKGSILPGSSFTTDATHQFDGWIISFNGESKKYPAGSSIDGIIEGLGITNGATVVATAQWAEKTVTFVAISWNDGSGSEPITTTVEVGAPVVPPTNPVKDNYVFMGWGVAGSSTPVDFANLKATVDTSYYAIWDQPWFTISFKGDGSRYIPALKQVDWVDSVDAIETADRYANKVFGVNGDWSTLYMWVKYGEANSFNLPVVANLFELAGATPDSQWLMGTTPFSGGAVIGSAAAGAPSFEVLYGSSAFHGTTGAQLKACFNPALSLTVPMRADIQLNADDPADAQSNGCNLTFTSGSIAPIGIAALEEKSTDDDKAEFDSHMKTVLSESDFTNAYLQVADVNEADKGYKLMLTSRTGTLLNAVKPLVLEAGVGKTLTARYSLKGYDPSHLSVSTNMKVANLTFTYQIQE